MRAELETLIDRLRAGTGRVELDLPPPQTAGSIEIASQLARERRASISRGDRAAYLYEGSSRVLSAMVTEAESRALIESGATWVGPDVFAPPRLVTRASRMIQHFSLREFKAHEDTELDLSRLTLLVGDNASGKTSVLEALLLQGALHPPFEGFFHGGRSIRNLLRRGAVSRQVTMTSSGYRGDDNWAAALHLIETDENNSAIDFVVRTGLQIHEATANGDARGFGHGGDWDSIRGVIGSAAMYRLRAECIAEAAYSHDPKVRVEEDGTNTAVVLAAMKLGDDERFEVVEEGMRRLVPSFERVRIRTEPIEERNNIGTVTRQGSKLYFDFQGAKEVPADGASHGTLILLSLLTILYGPHRPDLILIDDLEQGLHPRAQRELVRMLSDLLVRSEFGDLQIVATTHSPYALDLLDPEQIYAFAVGDNGAVASKRLSKHPDAGKTKDALTAGQLWSLDDERNWVLT